MPSCSTGSIAQHEAGTARTLDAAAQLVGGFAGVGAHPHLVERPGAAAAQQCAQNAGVAPDEHPRIALGETGVVGERVVAREAGGKLHAPWAGGNQLHPLLELGDERIGRALQQRHELSAIERRRRHRFAVAASRPFVDGDPCDGRDVIAGLGRERTRARQKVAHPLRPGIVGCGREPEIAELVAQLAQEFRRFRQGLHRIERIEQTALGRGPWHELRNTLGLIAAARARTDRIRLEATLLPDDPREKLERQGIRACRRFDDQADRFAHVGGLVRLLVLGGRIFFGVGPHVRCGRRGILDRVACTVLGGIVFGG